MSTSERESRLAAARNVIAIMSLCGLEPKASKGFLRGRRVPQKKD
jgi:hypothetical protein